jgi:hypothetical protein
MAGRVDLRRSLEGALPAFVLVALFPRCAAFIQAPGLFGLRGVVLYVIGWTLYSFGMLRWVLPAVRRHAEMAERERKNLRRVLGHEPTDEDFYRHLADLRRAPRWSLAA